MPRPTNPRSDVPRALTLRFKTGEVVPVSMEGEHRATVLRCQLPSYFEGVSSGTVRCQLDDVLVYTGLYGTDQATPFFIKDGELFVTLFQALTQGRYLQVEASGFLDGRVVQSPLSETLLFHQGLPDITEQDVPRGWVEQLDAAAQILGGDLIDTVAANTAARHTHENKSTLDKIGETDSIPTFDGQPFVQQNLINDRFEAVESQVDANAEAIAQLQAETAPDSGYLGQVFDTYVDLLAFAVPENLPAKTWTHVVKDETHDNATVFYAWTGTEWVYGGVVNDYIKTAVPTYADLPTLEAPGLCYVLEESITPAEVVRLSNGQTVTKIAINPAPNDIRDWILNDAVWSGNPGNWEINIWGAGQYYFEMRDKVDGANASQSDKYGTLNVMPKGNAGPQYQYTFSTQKWTMDGAPVALTEPLVLDLPGYAVNAYFMDFYGNTGYQKPEQMFEQVNWFMTPPIPRPAGLYTKTPGADAEWVLTIPENRPETRGLDLLATLAAPAANGGEISTGAITNLADYRTFYVEFTHYNEAANTTVNTCSFMCPAFSGTWETSMSTRFGSLAAFLTAALIVGEESLTVRRIAALASIASKLISVKIFGVK